MSTLPTRAARAWRVAASLGVALGVSLLGACASGHAPGGGERASVVTEDAVTADVDGLRVIGTYAAASGRVCRRLATPDGQVLARASCRGANGEWTLGRSLGRPAPASIRTVDPTSRAPESLVPESLVPVPPVAAAAPTVVTLRRDETLWSFAARVTGDPLNWTRIARLNGIADGDEVAAGRELSVPASIATVAR